MEYKKKTLIGEDNSEPPKDYIGIKADGKAYEFDYTTRTGVESKTIKSASGSGSSSTEGAVSYNEQTLTVEQQMQARANQGLYGIIEADNVPTSLIINEDSEYDREEDLSYLIPAGADIESITAFRISGSEPLPADKLIAINGESISSLIQSNKFLQSENYGKCYLFTSDGVFILLSVDNNNTSIELFDEGSSIITLDSGIWIIETTYRQSPII